MDKFNRENGINAGRGQYKLSSIGSFLIEETKKLLLNILHCENKKIVFTHSATEALNIILQGLVNKDDINIYVSPFEHNSVMRVLYHLEKIYKIRIITLAFDTEKLTYDLLSIKEQFEIDKPYMTIISHVSNVCGLISPINDIFDISKVYKSINVADLCQSIGHLNIDLNSSNIDFAVFAGHKGLYSSFGVGGFICNGDILPSPLIFGGTGTSSADKFLPATIPERFEVGSQNIVAIASLNASIKWINEVGIKSIIETENLIYTKLITLLKKYKNINIVGILDCQNNTGVVSCLFDGFSSDEIGKLLDEKDIAVRTGLHCSPTAHKVLNTFPMGTVRFSVGFFNNDNDLTRLEEALDYIKDNS